jgi:hypothetical protein
MICIGAILKHEGRFVEEWLAYHRLLGVDHFFLYDNDPDLPLWRQLANHLHYVTVIDWLEQHHINLPGRNKQTKAYENAVGQAKAFEWISFIDVDEFIVLRKDASLPQFLDRFPNAGAVSLNWHYFGHNGYFHDPEGLVIESLTRRRVLVGRMPKSFNRISAIRSIQSAHYCQLKPSAHWLDPNGRPYQERDYPGKTEIAHINHYACRSFTNWMSKVQRGEAAFEPGHFPEEQQWRCSSEGCLRQFVQTVARDMNEMVDEFLVPFAGPVRSYLEDMGKPQL